MKDLLFGWIYRPHFMMRVLDNVFMAVELMLILGVFVWAFFHVIVSRIRMRRLRKKYHGKNCICIVCRVG